MLAKVDVIVALPSDLNAVVILTRSRQAYRNWLGVHLAHLYGYEDQSDLPCTDTRFTCERSRDFCQARVLQVCRLGLNRLSDPEKAPFFARHQASGFVHDAASPPHLHSSGINDTLYLNVLNYGAKGDGKTDDTEAFHTALGILKDAGGGVLHVPSPHAYKILGTLSIPAWTTLQGSYKSVSAHPTSRSSPLHGGSTLLAYSGKGSTSGTPFITLAGENACIRGLVIYYPEVLPTTVPPIEYPWTIAAVNVDNAAIMDVELLNVYQGIYLQGAGRHYVARVQGQPLFKGVYYDAIYDIGRIENVHFNPWWHWEGDLQTWQKNNGIAFEFGRSDWEYVFNTFCFGYKIGYHFIETSHGATNGNFLGIGADLMTYSSVYVEQTQPMGLLITNGEFTAFEGPDSTQIRVASTNTGSVRLDNCNFWGPSIRIAELLGPSTVSFQNCVFVQWDTEKKGEYAVKAEAGNVQIIGSEFQEAGKNQIYLGAGVKKAVVMGNVMNGKLAIENHAVHSVVQMNVADE